MTTKRDPLRPGIPIDPKALAQRNAAEIIKQRAPEIQRGSLDGPPPEAEDPNIQTAPEPPEPAIPSNQIPASFVAGMPEAAKKRHPLLDRLEKDFGISRLECRDHVFAGYKWTFRPQTFLDYEWATAHLTEELSMPTLAACNVASMLAAIDDVPVYEIFGVDTIGRSISDPLNPPPDIRRQASTSLLEWFRNDLGLWEIISRLDETIDILFEVQRRDQYPLWLEMVSEERKAHLSRLLARSGKVSSTPSETTNGSSGEKPPPTSD